MSKTSEHHKGKYRYFTMKYRYFTWVEDGNRYSERTTPNKNTVPGLDQKMRRTSQHAVVWPKLGIFIYARSPSGTKRPSSGGLA
jgi:hypothetical protein